MKGSDFYFDMPVPMAEGFVFAIIVLVILEILRRRFEPALKKYAMGHQTEMWLHQFVLLFFLIACVMALWDSKESNLLAVIIVVSGLATELVWHVVKYKLKRRSKIPLS